MSKPARLAELLNNSLVRARLMMITVIGKQTVHVIESFGYRIVPVSVVNVFLKTFERHDANRDKEDATKE